VKTIRLLSLLVILLGIAGVIFGGTFVAQGISKNNVLKEAMRVEHVTLGIENADLAGEIIDSLGEAQIAGDTVREHRRGIAPTYSDLLGEGRYDPTDPVQLTYAQALNLENYLYLAVVAFGLTQSVTANGAFMLFTGLALVFTGFILRRLSFEIP